MRCRSAQKKNDARMKELVSEHFDILGSTAPCFARLQSIVWKEVSAPVTHYQFVTGWACMDVLTSATPAFARRATGSGRLQTKLAPPVALHNGPQL